MPTTAEFIKAHQDDDVRRLALAAAGDNTIDLPFALDQIAGRQTARRKLPSWAATEGITYPPHISMEQCSSEQTARYKAAVAARLAGGGRLIDITGGFGADFSFMARGFGEAVYIERQEHLCGMARANFGLLGLEQATVVNGDGVEYVRAMEGRAALIFADPARRNDRGSRTFAISDCTPDMSAALDTLLDKADCVMIKLSPMLDWRKAAADLGPAVREIHIVSAANECKELLAVASREGSGPPRIFCVNDDTAVEYVAGEESEGLGGAAVIPQPGAFLYEPNASIMKAGCFGLIERRYGVRQIGRNSHLFVSDRRVDDFPGRHFVIGKVTTMNRKELGKALAGISKANIAVRNFPLPVAALRKRLGIADGGDTYIFATTLEDRRHVLAVCSRITAEPPDNAKKSE